MRLQTIPSREVDPSDLAVVIVGSIHVGDAENIIPEVDLKINVRTTDPQTRSRVLASMKRIINAEAEASQACKSINSTQLNSIQFNSIFRTEHILHCAEKHDPKSAACIKA